MRSGLSAWPFQLGWMMRRSLDPDIARWAAGERANPQRATAAACGFV